jgi:hypothetical protein
MLQVISEQSAVGSGVMDKDRVMVNTSKLPGNIMGILHTTIKNPADYLLPIKKRRSQERAR